MQTTVTMLNLYKAGETIIIIIIITGCIMFPFTLILGKYQTKESLNMSAGTRNAKQSLPHTISLNAPINKQRNGFSNQKMLATVQQYH